MMKYLKKFSTYYINESKGSSKVFPINNLGKFLPKTIDDRIILWIGDNWGNFYKKSPYGHSYYNKNKSWDITLDGTLRLSDHWNFYDKKGKKHCVLDKNIQNNTAWTIAKYDEQNDIWNVLISFPYYTSIKNRINTYHFFKDKVNVYHSLIDELQELTHKGELFAKITPYFGGIPKESIVGKVLEIDYNKIILKSELEEPITFERGYFNKCSIDFMNYQKDIIHIKNSKESIPSIEFKEYKTFYESKEYDDLLNSLDDDEYWNKIDSEIKAKEKEISSKDVEYTWDTCDGCKYFDKSSLKNYLGFEHPIYSVIQKNKLFELVYMTPKQYIYNIANGFGVSYEDTMSAYSEEKSKKYAEDMSNGAKFPVGYYTVSIGDQEGRHRAMACMMLGVQTIPVVKITNLGYSDVVKYVKKFQHYTREDLDEYYKDVVPNGISDLDFRELERYIEYRL